MTLSPRQQRADFLARTIQGFGAWVVSPLPLDDAASLRYQVLDGDADRLVEIICGLGMGFMPARLQVHYRVTSSGLKPATLFEVNIPRERQQIPDRKIYGEVEERKKTDAEVEAVRRHLGMK
jgi:hypothetical protein